MIKQAYGAIRQERWRDHQVAALRKIRSVGWTRQDFRRLHYLTIDLAVTRLLLNARRITPGLVRTLWQTPDWMWVRELVPQLSKPDAHRLFSSRTNQEFLYGLVSAARPLVIQALKGAKSVGDIQGCLADARKSGLTVRGFPASPVAGTDALRPLGSFSALRRESLVTGVKFETFYDAIYDGVGYFFSWLGRPRATILVVFDLGIQQIECRKSANVLLAPDESAPLVAHTLACFERAGITMDGLHSIN